MAATSPKSSRRSSHRVAVVTGGAGGLGRATAERLSRDGHAVALVDRSESVHDLCRELKLAKSAQLDVTDPGSVADAMADIARELGGIDILVNAAGVAHRSSFAATSADEFMADVRINLLGTFLTCQAAVYPHMRAAGHGRLINIASASALLGGIGALGSGSGGRSGAGYASSKAGVVNLTRWIAREVGPLGITSNVVSPGLVWTNMTEGQSTYDDLDIPLGRAADPAEIASAVAWLASDDSTYVSGAVIAVDGGLTRA
ncbi:SDR family oxidoreductase [Streptomyces sp. NBC_00075]|uniref:SDR family NAD(P)-dependent oxidoreductase n=1 Tax=Streptomyces sp. NBC_00075 TaxID=2975641 RepID=UPI00324532CE